MKRKLAITAIVVLTIGFVGLAGGFTNEKYHTYNTAGCDAETEEITNADGTLEFHIDMPDACWSWTGVFGKDEEDPSLGTRTVFDPRSTAMFVIGGAIIALLPLARKKGRQLKCLVK